MHTYAFRLKPGEDLRLSLEAFAAEHDLQAGLVLTCVGSLRTAHLRLAGQSEGTHFEGPFEIVSLVGTFSAEGPHLHIALADARGQMIGGHLLSGCLIHTTAEVVLGALPHLQFSRPVDPETGYRELAVEA